MRKEKFDCILLKIAQENHITVQEVRREMELAMKAGQSNPDPAVQAMWSAIPRKGSQLTLEEFVEYLVKKTRMS